jgi:hypothetical protein
MIKRAVSAVLWLFVVAWAWNYASALLGVPQLVGPLLGVVVGAFVGIDPFGLFFPRHPTTPPRIDGPNRARRGLELT